MKKNNKKGFTLVELVIVVAVMAILVAVAIPTIGSIRASAQAGVNKSNAQTVESIIKLAESKYNPAEDDDIANELAAAKLGIDNASFAYDEATGDCTYGAPATGAADTVVAVVFATEDGELTVSYNGTAGDATKASTDIAGAGSED